MMFWKNKKSIFIFTFVAMVFFGALLAFSLVRAQPSELSFGLQPIQQNSGLGGEDIRLIIARIIRAVLGLLGIIAIGIMLWGGYVWMTSAGNEEKIGEAKKILINGVIGLVIILSAFSIAQFIINKLAGATGANTGEGNALCADPIYFKENLIECAGSNFCAENPQFCCEEEMKYQDLFVALSVTPKTLDTKMNNVAARAIFNMPINNQVSASGVIKIMKGAEDITSKFDFKFIFSSSSQRMGVEASFNAMNGVCPDNITACLGGGNYNVVVDDQLISESGKLITTGTTQCPYPLSADFAIKNQGFHYLRFDGTNGAVDLDSTSTANFTDKFSISFWLKAEDLGAPGSYAHIIDKHVGGTPGRGYIVYIVKSSQDGGGTYLIFDMRREDGKYFPIPIQKISLQDWHHVAWVYDGIHSYVYIDGVQKSDNHDGTGIAKKVIPYSDAKLRIGGEHTPATLRFKGGVDELRFYGRALLPEEVLAFANKREGPYVGGIDDKNGLVAGYHFDESGGIVAGDYSGYLHHGTLFGTGYVWQEDNDNKVKDSLSPVLSKLSLNGSTGVTQVFSGKLYTVADTITDNSGIGYGRVTIERTEVGKPTTKEVDYFNGPAVTRVGGSDAPADNPYLFKYPWVVQKVQDQSVMYKIIVDVWDIDHNHSSTSTILMAVPEHCSNGVQDVDKGETGVDVGGPCGDGPIGSTCVVDSQCSCGKCENNICVVQPKILDISPMDGAGGNWISILGKCFGDETGKVEFGYDSNNNGSISEDDIWAVADKVNCGTDDTWNDEWVIVEVPADPVAGQPNEGLPVNTSSSIRITHKDSNPAKPMLDYSTDGFGPKPGVKHDGIFFKNNIKRPGLCSVKAEIDVGGLIQKVAYGYPGVLAEAKGSGFGVNGVIKFGGTPNPLTYLLEGGLEAPVQSWTDTIIGTQVPNNMQTGKVSVYVTSGGQPSNGVPFTVKSQSELSDNIPVIDKIDPASSTRQSYITIYGHGFGNEKGRIYVTSTLAGAINCASGVSTGCQELNANLPEVCGGSTWQDKQVIAEITSSTLVGNYFIILKNKAGFYSSGQDKLTVKSGNPQPSICKIEPSHGPAPLPAGQFLNLFGINFAASQGATYAYFWAKGANPQNTGGWLSLSTNDGKELFDILNNGRQVKTVIPLTSGGLSMQTGPIKIKAGGVVGNSVTYTVEDCRQASVVLNKEMENKLFRCCTSDGPDLGLWKSQGLACAGEARSAGYVWRFTTGKIRQLPHVIEHCDEVDWNDPLHPPTFPSPVPSILWKKGKEACLNAEIAVKFSVPMDSGTLNEKNVKLFTCADGGLSANCKQKQTVVSGYSINTDLENGLYIKNVSLQPNTWYHVELSKDILSQDCGQSVAGTITKCFKDNLQVTRSCGIGTAYCFDFKTGTANCSLKDAGIEPGIYTANFLGKILNPAFPFDSKPEHPLYYLLWGRATQECTVLNVDGMGWGWGSTDGTKATVVNSPDAKKGYTDSRAEVTAWKEAIAPNPVFITAHTDELKTSTSTTSTIKQSYTATSTLYIDLYPPKVMLWWPNCSEACINATVGAQFNRPMYQSHYKNNIELWQCEDELCDETTNTKVNDWVLDENLSTDQVVRMKPQNDLSVLASSTWYMAKVKGGDNGVHALGRVPTSSTDTENIIGKPMAEDFVWKFRTRADDSPCKADKVNINPDPYIATMIGQKTKYVALPMALTAECGGPQGQELNPWVFGWSWDSHEETDKVASVTHFKTSSSTNQFCGNDCKLLGSDVSKDEPVPYLCGNGKVEPGEDCDIAKAGEIVGVSCGLNCLRLGNTNTTTCGNNTVEKNLGEECEPANSQYCTANCLNVGVSSMLPAYNTTGTSWCGSGKVTKGEECDRAIESTSQESKIGCSDMCLHLGTPLAQSWCDSHLDLAECKNAVSVCGNSEVESGEECEIDEEVTLMVRKLNGNSTDIEMAGFGTTASKHCDKNCLVHDVCDINDPGWNLTGLKCDKNQEGCRDDCTLAGSSLLYSTPSLCRDGVTNGIGEYPGCEATSTELYDVENPVQLVKAVGQGVVDELTKSQKTTVEATLSHYFLASKQNFEAFPPAGVTKGVGKYELKCGYSEFKKPEKVPQTLWDYRYNDCPGTENALTVQGVANNSCCYERPVRSAEYPIDGAGMNGTEAVCRNTFINVKFANRFIDAKTLSGNFVIATGYTSSTHNCSLNGEININNLVNQTMVPQIAQENSKSFWKNLWQKVKGWLARLVGNETFAYNYKQVEGIKVWCSGLITGQPSLYYEWNNDYSAVTTTVALYINSLLPKDSVVAVILLGGTDGLKDTQGISIRNQNSAVPELADAWYFMTGEEVCKLTDVTVEPDKRLFDKPKSTSTFHAITESTNGQQIVPIQGQYFWTWDWQPNTEANDIFDIPKVVLDNSTTTIVIGARNVEGNIIAVANAHVLQDVDVENNQVGKTFTGITNLTAMFCEHPWPQANYFPFEDGVGFGKAVNGSGFNASSTFDGSALPTVNGEYFNFRMSYCADAGQSGTTVDDLPYLKPILFQNSTTTEKIKITVEDKGHCLIKKTSECFVDKDCGSYNYYDLPYVNTDAAGSQYTGACRPTHALEQLVANNCKLIPSPSGNFCVKDSIYPPKDVPSQQWIACGMSKVSECLSYPGSVCRPAASPQWNKGKDKCIGAGTHEEMQVVINSFEDKTMSALAMRKILFVNDVNDDIVGMQIFDNPSRLDAGSWIKQKFPNLSGLNKNSVKGYEAMSDGKNYYINALNQEEYGAQTDLKNRIYLFSINKDAQESTLNVFNQLISSLEFNINISDFGYCMVNNPPDQNITKLPFGELQSHTNDEKSCVDDFECRDAEGLPLEGTNGICSNAKTKLQRDLLRLIDYRTIQTRMSSYMSSHANMAPELKSGTYLSGYTVSKWPSWGKLGTEVGGGLPTDKINKWNGCNEKADQLTCWDTASSTYFCPNYMQAYEYEYASSTKKYLLHGPLEYLTTGMSLFTHQVDPIFFTTEPWCQPNHSYNMSVGLCGNGVVNKGEECDPVGSSVISSKGAIAQKYGSCDYKTETKACTVNVDCAYSSLSYTDHTGINPQDVDFIVNRRNTDKTCQFEENLLIVHQLGTNNEAKVFDCVSDSDCQHVYKYNGKEIVEIGDGEVVLEPDAGLGGDYELGEQYACLPLDNTGGYDSTDLRSCNGAVSAGFGDCDPAFQQAYKVCTNVCQWSYSTCNDIFKCGNGIVEPGETCDDGGLNGTYGHCPISCKGAVAAYCGDGKVNTSTTGGKDLELCDIKQIVYQKGYCERYPDRQCSFPGEYGDCKVLTSALIKLSATEQKNIKKYCDFKPAGQGSPQDGYQCGPCQSFEEPSYDFKQENTCSWDCQKRVGYCGDGIKQSLEECDDGNKIKLDGCDHWCKTENLACIKNINGTKNLNGKGYLYLSYLTSPLPDSWDPLAFYNTGGATQISECFNNTSGKAICRALDLECLEVKMLGPCMQPGACGSNPNGLFQMPIDCAADLTNFYSAGIKNETYYLQCDGNVDLKNVDEPLVTENPEHYCGNQVVETYEDENKKEIKEACDMGPIKNGKECTPKYGKTCSYCSVDCKEILTVNPNLYCGNNEIDIIDVASDKVEACENSSIGVLGAPFTPVSCPDKGNYTCTNNCTLLNDNCVDCRLEKYGNTQDPPYKSPVKPEVKVVNVLNPLGTKLNWPIKNSATSSLILVYQKEQGGVMKLAKKPGLGQENYRQTVSSISLDSLPFEYFFGNQHIESNTLCNKPGGNYVIQFAPLAPTVNNILDEKEFFDFPVRLVEEGENLVNEYVISPVMLNNDKTTVRTKMIRIVARWTDEEDKVAPFKVVLQSNNLNGNDVIDYSDAYKDGKVSNLGYYPSSTKKYSSLIPIYFHPFGGSGKNYTQAVTIDYNYTYTTGTIRVLVEAINVPVAYFKNSNLQVEVYFSKQGQSPLKIYGPDHVFNIKASAGSSSNQDAMDWYVFDLNKNGSGVYVVDPVEQIKTSYCYIINENNPLNCQ